MGAPGKEGLKFIKNHPKASGGIAATALLITGVMCAGTMRALELGIDVFAPTGEIAPGPIIPGRLQPDTQPASNIKPEGGCLVVNQGDTPAGLLARTGERLYPGKRIKVIYTAIGHGGGQEYFPANDLTDLGKISRVIWAGDNFCPENPVQIRTDTQSSAACVTVYDGSTISGIIRTLSAPDGITDFIIVNRLGQGSDRTTSINPLSELTYMRSDIRRGDQVCVE